MTSPNAVTVTGNLTLAADTTLVNNSTLVLASGVPATPSTINLNGFTLTIQGTGATTIGDNIIDNSGGASNDGLIIDNTAGTVALLRRQHLCRDHDHRPRRAAHRGRHHPHGRQRVSLAPAPCTSTPAPRWRWRPICRKT